MFVDSHVHLHSPEFADDLPEVLARAQAAGVRRFLCPGTDLASSRAVIALAGADTTVLGAVGVHPHDARTCDDTTAAEIESLLAAHPGLAVGETGLDYYYDYSPRDVQQRVLRWHLAVARRYDRAVVVHNRDSDADMARILAADGTGLRLVLHAFGGSPTLADMGARAGFFFGIGGFLTFKKHPLAACVRDLPRQALLLETDAPYLSPHPLRGRRNEPAHVAIVAARLAALLGIDVDAVAALTTQNFARFIGDDGVAGSP